MLYTHLELSDVGKEEEHKTKGSDPFTYSTHNMKFVILKNKLNVVYYIPACV